MTIETDNVTLDETYRQQPPGLRARRLRDARGERHRATAWTQSTRAHLFEPFFTTKELGKGTGLGLATVFGIVKQNNGLINVDSEPGQGTTFKIYLPRARRRSAELPQPPRRQVPPRGTETVLLVEDEEQILNLGRRILEQHGYTVLTARTPEAALALAAEHEGPINLLITDVVMPGMNGKELRAQLAAGRPGSEVPLHVRLHRRRDCPSRCPGRRDRLSAETLQPPDADREGQAGAGRRLRIGRGSTGVRRCPGPRTWRRSAAARSPASAFGYASLGGSPAEKVHPGFRRIGAMKRYPRGRVSKTPKRRTPRWSGGEYRGNGPDRSHADPGETQPRTRRRRSSGGTPKHG